MDVWRLSFDPRAYRSSSELLVGDKGMASADDNVSACLTPCGRAPPFITGSGRGERGESVSSPVGSWCRMSLSKSAE